jgi:predicted GNAT family acetyltransferase
MPRQSILDAIVQLIHRQHGRKRWKGVDGVSAQANDVQVRKVERTRLYEAVIAGEVVGNLAYESTGGKTALTHSFVDPDRRNMGVGSALAEFALNDVTASRTRPVVYCEFVSDYVDAHPKWKGAVDVSHWTLIPTRSTPPKVTAAAPTEDRSGHDDPSASSKLAGHSQL